MEKVVVIGSGPAGLTAAIYLARAGYIPTVLEGMNPGGQITQAVEVENFPGFPNGISGGGLAELMHKQCEGLGVRFILDEALSIEQIEGGGFKISSMVSGEIDASSVIIATGCKSKKLGVQLEDKFLGRGISYCAVCDGAFFSKKRVAVVGGGDTALSEAMYLSKICEKVYLVHRRKQFRGTQILEDRVRSVENIELCLGFRVNEILPREDNAKVLGGVVLEGDGEERMLEIDGLFPAIGHTPDTQWIGIRELAKTVDGYIECNKDGETTLEGVFACGDVVSGSMKQAVVASASGCIAASSCINFLRRSEESR